MRRTVLGGVARFVGEHPEDTPGYVLNDAADFDLACAGIPVTVSEAGTRTWYATWRSHAEMTAADWTRFHAGRTVDVANMGRFPLAGRRTKLLDDLDAVTDGTFPVRVDELRPLRLLPRLTSDGRVESVTILNLSIGDTDRFVLRVRNPVSAHAVWQDAKMSAPKPLACSGGARACERTIPFENLPGWKIGTVFFE